MQKTRVQTLPPRDPLPLELRRPSAHTRTSKGRTVDAAGMNVSLFKVAIIVQVNTEDKKDKLLTHQACVPGFAASSPLLASRLSQVDMDHGMVAVRLSELSVGPVVKVRPGLTTK